MTGHDDFFNFEEGTGVGAVRERALLAAGIGDGKGARHGAEVQGIGVLAAFAAIDRVCAETGFQIDPICVIAGIDRIGGLATGDGVRAAAGLERHRGVGVRPIDHVVQARQDDVL